jgi:hypothetical protein
MLNAEAQRSTMPKIADDKDKKLLAKLRKKYDLEGEEKMLKINDEPINIAREAKDMIAHWGENAPTLADKYAAFFSTVGNEDKATDWMEVRKVIECHLSKPPGGGKP